MFETTAIDFNLSTIDPAEQQELRQANRKRILGCVRFIGELASRKVISPVRLMECTRQLLHGHSTRTATGTWTRVNEDCIEGLCMLVSACPRVFSAPKFAPAARRLMEELQQLRGAEVLSARVGFLVQDILDEGTLKSLCRERADGPMVLEDLHRKAA